VVAGGGGGGAAADEVVGGTAALDVTATIVVGTGTAAEVMGGITVALVVVGIGTPGGRLGVPACDRDRKVSTATFANPVAFAAPIFHSMTPPKLELVQATLIASVNCCGFKIVAFDAVPGPLGTPK